MISGTPAYRRRAPIRSDPQFGHVTPINASPESMFHPITPRSPWMATCRAGPSNSWLQLLHFSPVIERSYFGGRMFSAFYRDSLTIL
jgi:hypothetical protein